MSDSPQPTENSGTEAEQKPLHRQKRVVIQNRSLQPIRATHPTVVRSQKPVVMSNNSSNQGSPKTKVIRKPVSRIGQPDFSKSIITPDSSGLIRKKRPVPMAQRLFFDAAIAVVTFVFTLMMFSQI